MFRALVLATVAALLLVTPVAAKRAAPFSPVDKLVRADAAVIGKVTAIEKELLTAAPDRGATEKVSYTVAVVKVETALTGAANATHVKVGFVAPPKNAPAPGRGYAAVALAEGAEGLFFLTMHHSGAFYTLSPMLAQVETTSDNYKAQVAQTKRAAAVLAEPAKALKADKAADRGFAATVVAMKYRAFPENAAEVETVKVPADESRLVLKALAEANWKPDPNDATAPNAYQAFSRLGLTDADGWKFPVVKPGEDYIDKTKEAFAAWLDGAGKECQIRKFVRK